MNIDNPWKKRHQGDNKYIAECDNIDLLKLYNESTEDDDHKLLLNLPTNNVVGSPGETKLCILLLNPGVGDSEYEDIRNPIYVDSYYSRDDFWLIDQQFKNTSAYEWWYNKLAKKCIETLKTIDNDRHEDEYYTKLLIKNVSSVEFFPYHSKKFNPSLYGLRIESQKYAFDSIKKAIINHSHIIIAKGKPLIWYSAVPELYDYDKLYTLVSKQNSTLSINNVIRIQKGEIDERLKATYLRVILESMI